MNKKTGLATLLTCLLAACGGGGGGTSPGTSPTPSQVLTAPDKPLVDFAKMVAPWFAGSYGGDQCKNLSTNLAPQTLTISTDGTIKLDTITANFLTNTGISGQRKLDASGPLSSEAMFNTLPIGTPKTAMVFDLYGDRTSGRFGARTLIGTSTMIATACEKSADTNKPMNRPIYPLVAKLIEATDLPLTCLLNFAPLPASSYQLIDGVVKFNGEIYSLTSGLETESIGIAPAPSIAPNASVATYVTKSLDGRGFQVSLDQTGSLVSVNYTMKNGDVGICHAKQ